MPLSKKQVSKLIDLAAETVVDTLDCDHCFERLAEFADAELTNRELPEALRAVETHLKQCGCCRDEYSALLEAIQTVQDNP